MTGEGSDVMNRVVNQILSSMDGVESMEGVIVVAATNRPEMIDPALLRSGRFERVLHVPPPDRQSRLEILKIHSSEMPLGRFKLDDIADDLENYTGADIEAICREAALIAMRAGKKTVSKSHFERSGQQSKANGQQGHVRVLLQDGGDTCQWPRVCQEEHQLSSGH